MTIERVPKFAGDVDIESAIITTQAGAFIDIVNLIQGVQVFESIYSPFITGTLEIKDSLGLMDFLPMVGEEYLLLKISTPGINQTIEGQFFVYKASDRIQFGDKAEMYQLLFISVEGFIDFNKRISKRFTGTPSDIATQIIKDQNFGLQYAPDPVVETTTNQISFVSNYWNPSKCLQYLADHSLSIGNSPGFIAFQTHLAFNYLCLDTLYSNPPIQVFKQDHYSGQDINELYKRISTLYVKTPFNYLDKLQAGGLKSKQYAFDLISKNVSITEYSALNDFPNLKHLNKFALNTNGVPVLPQADINSYQNHYNLFDGMGDVSNVTYHQRRSSIMSSLSMVQVTVPGRCDYTAGITVQLDISKRSAIRSTSDDTVDKSMSGNYIVVDINHRVKPDGHQCIMLLGKESTNREISEASK